MNSKEILGYECTCSRGCRAVWLAALLVVATILSLSWLPQSQLGDQIPLPDGFAAWLDSPENANRRTAFPFLLLGIFLGALPGVRNLRAATWCAAMAAMAAVAGVAELGQHWLPGRTCDPRDIGWAALGGFTGLVTAWAFGRIVGMLRGAEEDAKEDADGRPSEQGELKDEENIGAADASAHSS